MIAMEEQIRELDEEDGERGKRGTLERYMGGGTYE